MTERAREIELGAIISGNATMSASISTRMTLAVQQMMAAARFSRHVGEIERSHAGEKFGGFWDEIFHYSIASVTAATASLEALANELYLDRERTFPGIEAHLLQTLWDLLESKPILDKFQLALQLKGRPLMNAVESPFQDVKALIGLRNALTHFKPEWDHELDKHRKLSNNLAHRFEPGLFLRNDETIFPRAWAGHGATSWAVNSSVAFAATFAAAADIRDRYAKFSSQLSP